MTDPGRLSAKKGQIISEVGGEAVADGNALERSLEAGGELKLIDLGDASDVEDN